jgi:hypothetical protein
MLYNVYESILPLEDFHDEYMILKTGAGWRFCGNSNGNNEDTTFWFNDLSQKSYYTDFLFNRIQDITGEKYNLDRVYANGQTYGLCGNMHVDSDDPRTKTFIIYMNPVWNSIWGGATVFHKDNIIESYIPTPNNGILFNSNIPHYGSDPTRHCKELRITVAYKLQLKE